MLCQVLPLWLVILRTFWDNSLPEFLEFTLQSIKSLDLFGPIHSIGSEMQKWRMFLGVRRAASFPMCLLGASLTNQTPTTLLSTDMERTRGFVRFHVYPPFPGHLEASAFGGQEAVRIMIVCADMFLLPEFLDLIILCSPSGLLFFW